MGLVHQECWNSPVHALLIPASDGLETLKKEGECRMQGVRHPRVKLSHTSMPVEVVHGEI